MRVVALFRVSTERQAEQGASLPAQRRRFRELAETNHWTVVAEFEGTESATLAGRDRRVLQQVLECIRQEGPDALYVHEQSRLTRGDELEVALLMRELRERGTKIIVNGVVRDLSSIDERFMVGIQSLVDRAESERIRERIARGKREKGRAGRKNCGRAPYGFYNPPVGHANRGTLQVVPAEAAVVRRIFELAADGEGLRTIAEMLNREGVPPRPGASVWKREAVRFILNNVAYLGTHASNVWKVGPDGVRRQQLTGPNANVVAGAHEAIVTRDLWDRANGRRPHTAQRPSLLGGLLWVNGARTICETCKEVRYYVFRGLRNGPRLRTEEAEEAVWSALSRVLLDPAVIEECLREGADGDRSADLRHRIAQAEAQVGKLNQRAKRLLELHLDGDIDKAAYRQGSEEIQEGVQSAEAALARMRAELESSDPDRVRRALSAVRLALAPAAKLDEQGQRALLRSIVQRIDVQAVREAAAYRKGEGGRFQPGRRVHWKLSEIKLSLGNSEDDRGCEEGRSSR